MLEGTVEFTVKRKTDVELLLRFLGATQDRSSIRSHKNLFFDNLENKWIYLHKHCKYFCITCNTKRKLPSFCHTLPSVNILNQKEHTFAKEYYLIYIYIYTYIDTRFVHKGLNFEDEISLIPRYVESSSLS